MIDGMQARSLRVIGTISQLAPPILVGFGVELVATPKPQAVGILFQGGMRYDSLLNIVENMKYDDIFIS